MFSRSFDIRTPFGLWGGWKNSKQNSDVERRNLTWGNINFVKNERSKYRKYVNIETSDTAQKNEVFY